MLASAVSSSVIQPFFGLWSDRRGAIWLCRPAWRSRASGIALASDAPSYPLVALASSSPGSAWPPTTPRGSKFAAYASGHRRASGMSLFSIGGNLGYALGPTLTTPLVLALGLRAACCSRSRASSSPSCCSRSSRYLGGFAPEPASARGHRAGPGRRDRLLLGVIAFRSVAWFGLITFVPLWEVSLGHSKAHGNHLLSLMLLAGGVGTLVAGPLADRFGRRPVLAGQRGRAPTADPRLRPRGRHPGAIAPRARRICVIGTFGVTMVMSQEYLPRHVGMASGLSIGLSIGLGGIAAVALGAVADAVDLETALLTAPRRPCRRWCSPLLLPSTGARARPPGPRASSTPSVRVRPPTKEERCPIP